MAITHIELLHDQSKAKTDLQVCNFTNANYIMIGDDRLKKHNDLNVYWKMTFTLLHNFSLSFRWFLPVIGQQQSF